MAHEHGLGNGDSEDEVTKKFYVETKRNIGVTREGKAVRGRMVVYRSLSLDEDFVIIFEE